MFCLQSNPIARWHICQSSINGIAFSTDGAYLATVGRDGILLIHYTCDFTSITYYKGTDIEHFNVGYLRVFDYQKEQLICGGKSYYGALLCCAWR